MERWVKYEGFATAVQTTLSTIAAGIMLGTSADTNSLEFQSCNAPDGTQTAFNVNTGGICLMQVQCKVYEGGNGSNSCNTRCLFRFGWEP